MKSYAVTLLVNLKVGINEFLVRGQKFIGPFEELPKPVQGLITDRRHKVATVTELKPEVEVAEINLDGVDLEEFEPVVGPGSTKAKAVKKGAGGRLQRTKNKE